MGVDEPSNHEKRDTMTTFFARRLQHLFETRRKPDGSLYTQEDVLAGTNGALTRGTIWKLRNGRTKNPSYDSIKALSDFFDVSPAYFFEEKKETGESNAEGELRLEQVALRAAGIDESVKNALMNMVDFIQNYEAGKPNEHENISEVKPDQPDAG
jgi:transcriptional regulator with XRE-family HTH domain